MNRWGQIFWGNNKYNTGLQFCDGSIFVTLGDAAVLVGGGWQVAVRQLVAAVFVSAKYTVLAEFPTDVCQNNS